MKPLHRSGGVYLAKDIPSVFISGYSIFDFENLFQSLHVKLNLIF